MRLGHSEVNGISCHWIIAAIPSIEFFFLQVWDLSFESYWSGASCKVTMIGHMHTVRCLQVKRQFSSMHFHFQRRKFKQLGIFLAAKSSIDKLILNLETSYKSVQSCVKSNNYGFLLTTIHCRICESLSFLSFMVLSATAVDAATHTFSPI